MSGNPVIHIIWQDLKLCDCSVVWWFIIMILFGIVSHELTLFNFISEGVYFLHKYLNWLVKNHCFKRELFIKEMWTSGSYLDLPFYFDPTHLFHNTSIVKVTNACCQDTVELLYCLYGSSSPLCLINYVGFINYRTQLSGGRCMLFII